MIQPAVSGPARPLFPYKEFFALDLRSLAFYRIVLGILLLIDLQDRIPDLHAHWCDDGIFPRSALVGLHPISVHMLDGSAWFQGALLGLGLFLAFLLILGYRTTLVTLLSWFLFVSSHTRCPITMQGGDHLLRMMLFWSVFLPLGARWSVDSALSDEKPTGNRLNSIGAVAYVLQICMVYWFAAAWKWAPEWREEASAVHLTLQIDFFATRFSAWLRDQPAFVLQALTHGTIGLESLGPVVLFLPFSVPWQRLFAIVAFTLFHVGLAISMELGPFPWTCVVAWAPFLPGAFWDKIAAHYRNAGPRLTLLYDPTRPRTRRAMSFLGTILLFDEGEIQAAQGDSLARIKPEGGWAVVDSGGERYRLEALRLLVAASPLFFPFAGLLNTRPGRWLGEALTNRFGGPAPEGNPATPAAGPARWRAPSGTIANTVALFCLAYVVLWNFGTFLAARNQPIMPTQMAQFGIVMGLEQGWGLFAPWPMRLAGWHVIVGIDEDGNEVNVLTGEPVDWEKPELLAATYTNARWRKMMQNLPDNKSYPNLAQGYSRWALQNWNRTRQNRTPLKEVSVYWMREITTKPGDEPLMPDKILLGWYTVGAPTSWFVVAGTRKDGTKVDLIRDGGPALDWRRPATMSSTPLTGSWSPTEMVLEFARFRHEEWNKRHDAESQLSLVEVYRVRSAPAEDEGLMRELLFRHPEGKSP